MKKSDLPKEGEHWHGHGGIYIGRYRDGDNRYHLIAADTPESKIEAPWGEFGKKLEGEFSYIDGTHNTSLILAADPNNVIANAFKKLVIDGHNDFFFPAQKQLMLGYINTPEIFAKEWHWSSTQCSASLAWILYFEDGITFVNNKYHKLAARAVRRELVIE